MDTAFQDQTTHMARHETQLQKLDTQTGGNAQDLTNLKASMTYQSKTNHEHIAELTHKLGQIQSTVILLAQSLGWEISTEENEPDQSDEVNDPDQSIEASEPDPIALPPVDERYVSESRFNDMEQTINRLLAEQQQQRHDADTQERKRARIDQDAVVRLITNDPAFIRQLAARVHALLLPADGQPLPPAPPPAAAGLAPPVGNVEDRLARLERLMQNAGLDNAQPDYSAAGGRVLDSAVIEPPATAPPPRP
jgi:hypothetical protein